MMLMNRQDIYALRIWWRSLLQIFPQNQVESNDLKGTCQKLNVRKMTPRVITFFLWKAIVKVCDLFLVPNWDLKTLDFLSVLWQWARRSWGHSQIQEGLGAKWSKQTQGTGRMDRARDANFGCYISGGIVLVQVAFFFCPLCSRSPQDETWNVSILDRNYSKCINTRVSFRGNFKGSKTLNI